MNHHQNFMNCFYILFNKCVRYQLKKKIHTLHFALKPALLLFCHMVFVYCPLKNALSVSSSLHLLCHHIIPRPWKSRLLVSYSSRLWHSAQLYTHLAHHFSPVLDSASAFRYLYTQSISLSWLWTTSTGSQYTRYITSFLWWISNTNRMPYVHRDADAARLHCKSHLAHAWYVMLQHMARPPERGCILWH